MMAAQPSSGPLRVLGRYALYNEIAAGGMATVHIGRLLGPVGFARTVAIKRLHPQYAKDPEFASMFLDEARLAARVQHPNVVATIDVVATDGELFLIMDYVRGESLSRLVRTAKKAGEMVPPRIAAAIMCGFLHGLHAAHEAKNERGEPLTLVHRDVSPQNVLVGADGIARVLDFGIAKAAGRIQVTKDGQIKGKLAYMPPEQLAGRELNRTVDIYASAVVMWETLTGERLFKGDSEAETLTKILRDPVPPPSMADPRIPASFDGPILRALSREPGRRQQTAKELALELERCVGIASPTEVGEWVERIAGQILSARETQIAQIESASASIRLPPESQTDSDISGVPISREALAGLPPSSPNMVPSGHYRTQTAPIPDSARGVPPASESNRSLTLGTGSRMTGTMSLPVDRKWPIIATVAGLIVLLGIVGFVIAGKGLDTKPATPAAPDTSASASSVASGHEVPPPPPPSASVAPPTSASAVETTPTPPPSTPPAPKGTVKRFVPPPPPPPAPAPAPKKNCDPPYTIDASGHKKYKLECM